MQQQPSSSPIIRLLAFFRALDAGGEPLGSVGLEGVLRRAHDAPHSIEGEVGGVAAAPSPAAPPAPPWPDLPLAAKRKLPGSQVGKVVLMALCDDEISGDARTAGLTPARLRSMFAAAGVDTSDTGRSLPALALWLADAGVLADAGDTSTPWANPRPLATNDADEVARRLHATPPPTPDAVKAARDQGLK